MNSKELYYFLEVCKEGNIKKAADNLFISPQGLSKSIKKLEDELGCSLFSRSNAGIFITESGKILKSRAKHIIQEIEDTKLEISNINQTHSNIKVACSYGVLSSLTPNFIFEFMRKYPNITLECREYTDAQAEQELLKNNVDYALIVGGINNHIFFNKKLASFNVMLQVYSGHELYDKNEIEFDMLDGQDIILESKDFYIYHDFVKRCNNNNVKPNIVFETTEISFALQLCQTGMGLALTVDFVASMLYFEGLRSIAFADKDFTWDIYLTKKSGTKVSSIYENFEEFLVNWCNKKSI